MDEADSIKNDGEYLYMLGVGGSRRVDWQQGKTLIIAKAFPADKAHVVHCPNTIICTLSSCYYVSSVRILMCPHSTMYVSSCYCMCPDR